MKENLVNKMLELKDTATKSQRKLIDYLMTAQSKDVIYMSITELGETAQVGEATILRFCRALGYRGYQDFKLELAQGVSVDKELQEENFASCIADNMIETLVECKKKIDLQRINNTIDIILNSKTISLFGSGNSIIAAQELHAKLLKLGIYSNVEIGAHMQNICVSNMDENDCLIVFSVSGCSKEGIEIIDIAKANKAKIIVITSYEKSPMAKLADEVLLSVKNESPQEGGSTAAKVGQLYIAEIIYAGITMKDKKKYIKKIGNSNQSVIKKLI